MAAPIGHVFCALALFNSGITNLTNKDAFLVGTSLPDIRYIADIRRTHTHKLRENTLKHVLDTESSFEAGRRFHVFVDQARERYMQKKDAYRFVNSGPLKTQMLKIIEDHIMFSRMDSGIDFSKIFSQIYQEELSFGLEKGVIEKWHEILISYLNQNQFFNFWRYLKTLMLFQQAYSKPKGFFVGLVDKVRTFSFFIYAYFQVEKISKNQELREIIIHFYEIEIKKIINQGLKSKSSKTSVEYFSLDPPKLLSMITRKNSI